MTDMSCFNDLLISSPHSAQDEFESTAVFRESDPYIRWLSIDFAVEDDNGSALLNVYDEKIKSTKVGRMFGALVLAGQAYFDDVDIVSACDECDNELAEAIFDLQREGVLERPLDPDRNTLYIHSLEFSSEVIDSSQCVCLIDEIPAIVFQYANVQPDLVCSLADCSDEYYNYAIKHTSFDP